MHVQATDVQVNKDELTVHLRDGRTIIVPLAWYPRLRHGTVKERANWRLIGQGEGIHWPDLDEDISIGNLLLGKLSGESQASFKRWLEPGAARKTRELSQPRRSRHHGGADDDNGSSPGRRSYRAIKWPALFPLPM